MAALSRILVILMAYLVASVAATAVIVVATYVLMLTAMPGTPLPTVSEGIAIIFQLARVVFIPVVALAFVPAMVIAAIAEIFRLRSVLFYAIAAGAVGIIATIGFRFGMSLVLFKPKSTVPVSGLSFSVPWSIVAAGIVAGVVYWVLAGRNAGAWRKLLATPPTQG
jgi:hypothetical protein